MEKSVIGRGILAGAISGVLAFIFARIFAEPVIGRAIDYESARDAAEASLSSSPLDDDPELFSRAIQANVGIGIGIIAMGCAMGALFAVVYCLAAPRLRTMTPRGLSLAVAMSMFLGIYLIPSLKYPANPPAIGDADTISERGGMYLLMVVVSCALVCAGWMVAHAAAPRIGSWYAMLCGGATVLIGSAVAIAAMPSFHETPQPLRGTDGTIVLPGFDADDLSSFRLYSLAAQLILWLGIGLVGGELLHRLTARSGTRRPAAVS